MNLTPEQQAAVESDERDILVIAGAGSGKTRVLTERVKRLLAGGADPASIMCLTFTRKAARELKDRLAGAAEGMLLGTFHSVALQILRAGGAKLGYKTDALVVIDEFDANVLLKSVAQELGWYDGEKWKSGYSLARFTRYREAFYTGRAPAEDRDALRAFRLYAARLHNMNLLDFGAILAETRRLLRDHPDVLERGRAQIHHVLVDELQDTDAVQYDLHDFFAPPATFFGVGDTRQSIYRFRGGRPDLMFERHPGAAIMNLTECFRCGSRIVEAANRCIALNDEPHTVPIRSATGRDGIVDAEVREFADSARAVLVALRNYLPTDVAVLGRNRRLLRAFQRELLVVGVPSYIVGERFEAWTGDAFRELYAALRLSVNPGDDLAFLTIAHAQGISPSHVARARKKSAYEGVSLLDAMGREAVMCGVSVGDPGVAKTAFDLWGDKADDPREPGRANAVRWWTEICAMGIPHGLEWFATLEPQDDTPPADAVTLSTIHSAKGLEWPVVFVLGLNEGVFPARQAINADEVPEERRVFYVAVTRARERLALHARPFEYAEQSRFVIEAMGTRKSEKTLDGDAGAV